MQQTRLIRLLSTLNSAEFKRLEDFINSPYFNKSDTVKSLFEFLKPFYPAFDSSFLTAELAISRVFAKGTKSIQSLHDVNSSMTRLLEEFFAIESLKSDEAEMKFHLSNSLLKDGRLWYFNKIWLKSIDQEEGRDATDWLAQYRIWEQGLRFAQLDKRRIGETPLDIRLQKTLEKLDRFYLTQKLQLGCEVLNRQRIVNTAYEPELLEELATYLKNEESMLSGEPVIHLYTLVLELLKETSDEAFSLLMKALEKNQALLSRGTGLAMYSYAQNYCIRQINKGRKEFLETLFLLYQQMLTNQFLLEEDGSLAHWNYKNITTVALRLKKFDWVQEFLQQFKSKLKEDIRESVYHYNLAAARYEETDYKAALKLLQQTDFTDVHYDLSARSMILKIYYEMEDDDALGYAIQAFEVFLRRNKSISKDHFLIHKNLIRYLKKINRLRNRLPALSGTEGRKRFLALQEELDTAVTTANLAWLQSKIKELHDQSAGPSPDS